MAKTKKSPTLRIIKITEYKGFKIMIQHIPGANLFQCILYKNGEFYQAHDILLPPKGQKEHSVEDIVKAGVLYLDTAMIIADKIEEANEQDLSNVPKPPKRDLSKLN